MVLQLIEIECAKWLAPRSIATNYTKTTLNSRLSLICLKAETWPLKGLFICIGGCIGAFIDIRI